MNFTTLTSLASKAIVLSNSSAMMAAAVLITLEPAKGDHAAMHGPRQAVSVELSTRTQVRHEPSLTTGVVLDEGAPKWTITGRRGGGNPNSIILNHSPATVVHHPPFGGTFFLVSAADLDGIKDQTSFEDDPILASPSEHPDIVEHWLPSHHRQAVIYVREDLSVQLIVTYCVGRWRDQHSSARVTEVDLNSIHCFGESIDCGIAAIFDIYITSTSQRFIYGASQSSGGSSLWQLAEIPREPGAEFILTIHGVRTLNWSSGDSASIICVDICDRSSFQRYIAPPPLTKFASIQMMLIVLPLRSNGVSEIILTTALGHAEDTVGLAAMDENELLIIRRQ